MNGRSNDWTEAVEPLGELICAGEWRLVQESRGLGVAKQSTVKGIPCKGRKSELGLLPAAPSSRRQSCPGGA